MKKKKYPREFIKLLKTIDAKRPRTVINHILEYGQITTEELKNTYGYNHPPRAIRDVREQGIPIKTFRVTGSDGRNIAAYKFGDCAHPPIEPNHGVARIVGIGKLRTQSLVKHVTGPIQNHMPTLLCVIFGDWICCGWRMKLQITILW